MTDTEDRFEIHGLAAPDKQAATTEKEILECLRENLKLAKSCAIQLFHGERGDAYPRMREALELVYGATRQIAGWRGDGRWLPFGMYCKEVQEKARTWLVDKRKAKYFGLLADILEQAEARALDLETKKTGRSGLILPKPRPAETITQGRSIFVPAGFKDIRNVN